MRRSISRSSTTPDAAPERRAVAFCSGAALSVDVEEWYHNCWAPDYVDPRRRGRLVEELDRLLPDLLDRLGAAGAKATFFVLGEVARRLPAAIRAVDRAGHEIACHGELHLRANDRSPAEFGRDIRVAKARLEDLVGREVVGFRAPEWSLRDASNPRTRLVAEAGFRYDSSLAPALGAGGAGNPRAAGRLSWSDGLELLELPPLVWGGRLRLPAGGWCGRIVPPRWLRRAAERSTARGELPLFVVHPWELVGRPCPGLLTGFARFFHEAGRDGYAARFDELIRTLDCRSTLAERCAALPESAARSLDPAGVATVSGFGARAAEQPS